MHELSICRGIINQAEALAVEHNARRVTGIKVLIGPLSGVEPALLAQAFPLASAASVADGAELQIEYSAVVVRCTACDTESEVAPNRLLCKKCGAWQTQVIRGDEMLLASLELEKNETEPDRLAV
ncbi:MAG: hydrogenase maturation nickel metallochaperone HypA [Pseudomonadota bacterium]|nr:MAG: hydrogenase maturation nickel metallochaperone HypA [Pseudomonadota bacterium]